jgi:putative nucleotidyltransferase with HDIG domain
LRLYPIWRKEARPARSRSRSPDLAPTRIVVWTAGLSLAAGGLALGFSLNGWSLGDIWTVGFLALVGAVGERGRVRLTNSTEVSISLIPTLFAAVLFGPLASMLVAAFSFVGDFGQPYLKWVSYTSSRAIAGCLAGVAAFETPALAHGFGKLAIATGVGALVAGGLDAFFVMAVGVLKGHRPADVARIVGPPNAMSLPLYAPVVAALAFSYREVSPWTLLLFFAPALAAQRLFGLYQHERLLAENLSLANQRLERANISFATALVATLDARDRYTAGHSAAVAIYARDIAARLGLREEEQQLAHLCGLVHDIGKIGLAAGLLEKPGPLTLEERRQMQKHSEIGEHILGKVDDYAEIAKIVRHHHERWDGEGYPDGLAQQNIPLISRIIGVADAYNAMTSDRPYRDAMPSRVARMRLAQGVESQFDTAVAAAFEAILAGATESYRMASRQDFSLTEQDSYSEPFAEVA